MVLVNLMPSWIACTRNTEALRSAVTVSRFQLTNWVDDTDAACAELEARG